MKFRENLTPLSKISQHRKYKRLETAGFAKHLDVAEIGAFELGDAVANYPMGFYYSDGVPVLGVLFTLIPGTNFYVLPDGSWAAPYVPAQLRAWPFCLVISVERDAAVFCLDELGLCQEGEESATNSVALYNDDGEPSEGHAAARKLLERFYSGVKQSRKAAKLLDEAGLLKPWELVLERDAQQVKMDGLYHVDEAALQKLAPEKITELFRQGAVALAYAQLLSERRIDTMQVAASAHARSLEKKHQLEEEFKNIVGVHTTEKIDFDF